MGNTMSMEMSSRLLKRQPEIQKRTKEEDASQEPQERKSRKLCKERGRFRREQMPLRRQIMLRAGGEEPGPGALDLATWSLGKSCVGGELG